MKQYTSRKSVLAMPMNRLEYNNYRGWKLPDDENGSDEGYLVEYMNASEPNHKDHQGYISWSPKNIFDDSHRAFDPKSEGCIRVGIGFNPSSNDTVDVLKTLGAELIDRTNELIESGERSEKARCVNVAKGDIETGTMYAVKSLFR